MDDIKEKGNALANRAVAFINSLKHTKGVWYGKNFELLPWQDKIVRDLFGTLKPNGYRQYNTAYIEIPKKQGKSELAAAVALYLTCGDGEYGAEVYGCAADRQQASIVFDVAVEMINQCPALKKRCKILASQKRIVYLPLKSFYQVLSAESYTKHGLNVHGVIFDELHAQPNRALYDVMLTGSGDARKQPAPPRLRPRKARRTAQVFSGGLRQARLLHRAQKRQKAFGRQTGLRCLLFVPDGLCHPARGFAAHPVGAGLRKGRRGTGRGKTLKNHGTAKALPGKGRLWPCAFCCAR